MQVLRNDYSNSYDNGFSVRLSTTKTTGSADSFGRVVQVIIEMVMIREKL